MASYVPWICHEETEGEVDLDGHGRPELDLGGFIDLCRDRGLWFFVRPEIVIGEQRELQELASQVIYLKTKPALTRTPPPATLPAWNHYRAAKPLITHDRPLPRLAVEPLRKLGMVESELTAQLLDQHPAPRVSPCVFGLHNLFSAS